MRTTSFNGQNSTLCLNGRNSTIVFHDPTSKSQLHGRTPASQHLLFCCGSIVFVEDLVFEGESSPDCCVDFNNSPITNLVALKCGSARKLVISVTLANYSQCLCPALTGELRGNKQHSASPLGTW